MRRSLWLPTVDRMTGMDARDTELKKELNATLQARRELGDEYESGRGGTLMEKVGPRHHGAGGRRRRRPRGEQQMATARGTRSPKQTDSFGERFGFGIVSLVAAIPLSGIGGGVAGLRGLLVTWIGIVGINVVQAVRNNPDLFRGRRKPSKDEDRWED